MQTKLPKFILTENLNRLSKWMRMLGYDSVVSKSISFNNIMRIAAKDRRIILTRDKKHLKLANKQKVVLITSVNHLQQIEELMDILKFDEDLLFTRCLECNKLLYEISKDRIKELVPEYILEHQKLFKICRKCGRIYWRGTHYKKMLTKLCNIFNCN